MSGWSEPRLDASMLSVRKRYAFKRTIGRGTAGVVYCADDLVEQRTVAVKRLLHDQQQDVLSLEEAEQVTLDNGLDEMRALQRIDSPHVVRALDAFIDALDDDDDDDDTKRRRRRPQTLYLVMSFVDGGTLADRLFERGARALSSAALARYAGALVAAVAACHGAGVLHRDIKPENVFIDVASDTPVLGDLSLSTFGVRAPHRIAEPACDALRADEIYHDESPRMHQMVTLWYRPPETCAGSRRYSESTDAWSLGTVLAECIVGVRLWPYDKPAGVLLAQHTALAHAPARAHVMSLAPRARVRSVPATVLALVDALLVVERDRRPSLDLLRTIVL